jgi:phosphatidylserine/phosphatidylglycerophosphate/cardiolipin synthase-like enzyme
MKFFSRCFRLAALAIFVLSVNCAAQDGDQEAVDNDESELQTGVAIPKGCTPVDQGSICWAFNRIVPNAQNDRTITEEMVRLIDNEAGGSLKLNVYILGPDIFKALETARNAHRVDIQATIDGGNSHYINGDDLHGLLGSSLHVCRRGNNSSCLGNGTGGIAHVKFMNFSGTTMPGGTTRYPTTMFTTANFGGGSLHGNWNNLLAFYDTSGKKDLYRGVDEWADDMYAERRKTDYGKRISSPGFGAEVWASPTGATDIWAKLLGRFGGYRGMPSGAPHDCKVWVMADLARIDGPLDELDRLRRAGCTVKMTVSQLPDTGAQLAGARARLRKMYDDGVQFRKVITHEKTVVIQGRTTDGDYGKWVLTGSNNFYWSGHASNDEAIVEVKNDVLRDRYAEHFWDEWNNAADWVPPARW